MLGIIIFRYEYVWSLLCFLYFTVIANNLFFKKPPSPLFVSNNKVGEQHVDVFYTLKKLPPCNLNCVFSCCCFAKSLAIAFFVEFYFATEILVFEIFGLTVSSLSPIPLSSFLPLPSLAFFPHFPFLKKLRLAFFTPFFLWTLIASILSLNIYNLECS